MKSYSGMANTGMTSETIDSGCLFGDDCFLFWNLSHEFWLFSPASKLLWVTKLVLPGDLQLPIHDSNFSIP